MISTLVIGILMLVVAVVMLLGIGLAFISIILNYTGRSTTYDRAEKKIRKSDAESK